MSESNDLRIATPLPPYPIHGDWPDISLKIPNFTTSAKRQGKFALLLIVSLFLMLPAAFAQSKKELEEKRKKLMRDIEVTNNLLKKTTKTKETTYDRYVTLQKQIERREKLIRNIEDEIAIAERGISRNVAVMDALNRDIDKMQAEYGRMVRNAFRQKVLSNPILYILSANNLNQAFRRWLFMRKYDSFRKKQANAIADTREMLSKKVFALEDTRREKEALLISLRSQKTILTTELSDKNNLLQTLAQDESKLKSELEKKQSAHEAMNKAIERIIQDEINKRTAESRAARPAQPKSNTATSPVKNAPAAAPEIEDNISSAFRQKRGQLPWPVEGGFIARAFGRQKHPTLKNIEITNNGIDIRTEEAAVVRAVHDGRVAGVQYIPGHDYTLIVQHGDYYTVYSNLVETNVAKGDQVRARQVVGRVSTNVVTGASELHFEVWNQKERMNPEIWIRK